MIIFNGQRFTHSSVIAGQSQAQGGPFGKCSDSTGRSQIAYPLAPINQSIAVEASCSGPRTFTVFSGEEWLSLFISFSAKPQRCCVSRTLKARDGFLERQDGFMRFLKDHAFGANYAEWLRVVFVLRDRRRSQNDRFRILFARGRFSRTAIGFIDYRT
jgi:hypothetical protein